MDVKMNLKDFMNQTNPTEVKEVPVVEVKESTPAPLPLITDEDFTIEEVQRKMPSKSGGLIPELDAEDINEIKSALYKMGQTHEALHQQYAKAMRHDGMTDEEIAKIPLSKFQMLGQIIVTKRKKYISELVKKGHKVEALKEMTTVQLEDLIDNKNQNTTENRAIESVEVIEDKTTTEETKPKVEEEVKPKEEEVIEDEMTLKDVLSKTKDITIKYVDKPMNSYRRQLFNKSRKLLDRQKRGKYADIFLPNSNIKLRIYELHQPTIVREIMSMEMSQGISMQRKSLQLLLERSEVIASNGDEISVDGLMHYISVNDIPYIQLGAAIVNAVDKVPYITRCQKCGKANLINLNVNKLLTDTLNSIPSDVIAEFKPEDTFEEQITKSTTKLTADVIDEKAYCVINIANVSISEHLIVTESGKQYIVNNYKDLLPAELKEALLDNKYEHLLSLGSPEIIKDISALLVAQFVKEIKYYKFNTEKGTEWNDDVNLDFSFTLDDPIDTLLEAIQSMEESTLKVMEKLIEEKFIKAKFEVTTGTWQCNNCQTKQDTPVVGLELLMSSLQDKTLRDM